MIDRCNLITKEGVIAVVIGNKHKKEGVFGLISYIPKEVLKNENIPKDYSRVIFGKEYIKISDMYIKNWSKNSYNKALKLLSRLLSHYDYKDEFWGRINFFPKEKILKIFEREDYNIKGDEKMLKELRELFNLKYEELNLVSTRTFGPNLNSDFDIVIKGLSNSIKVRNKIRKILENPENRFITPKGTPHNRIFLFKGAKIDPFFKYAAGEDPLGKFSCKVGNYKKIKDVVIDDTYSIFTPAMYKLKRNGFLMTYFVKHKGLLKKGDIVKFKAKEIDLNSLKFSGKGLLIDCRGEWIEILK